MLTARDILEKLRNSRLSESFVQGSYKYWKYAGVCYKCEIDTVYDRLSGEKEEISEDEYQYARSKRNDQMTHYHDLDDETIHDIKRMSHTLLSIKKDNELTHEEKQRYYTLVNRYLAKSQEHNIPIKDYEPKGRRAKIYHSELNYILDKYTPPLPKSEYSLVQTYDPIHRKYKS